MTDIVAWAALVISTGTAVALYLVLRSLGGWRTTIEQILEKEETNPESWRHNVL